MNCKHNNATVIHQQTTQTKNKHKIKCSLKMTGQQVMSVLVAIFLVIHKPVVIVVVDCVPRDSAKLFTKTA
jgi:hypothetical protein